MEWGVLNMKRLIKSEFFDAQGKEKDGNCIEIFKNPTQDEANKVKRLNKWNAIRGIIDTDGIIYVWTGSIVHDQLKNPKINTDNGFHIAYADNGWVFDIINLNTTFKNVYKILNEHKNQLSQIGSLNRNIFIGETKDNFGISSVGNGFFHFDNWDKMDEYVNSNEYLNKVAIKISRLASSYITTLNSFVLGSGDTIGFDVRIVNNKPWFQIIHEHEFYTSNYYDGDDFEIAYKMYEELLLAFKRIPEAENLRKSKNSFKETINKLFQTKKQDTDNYFTLKRAPSFLGVNGF